MIIDTDDIIDQSMLLAESQMRRDSNNLVINKTPQADGKLGKRLSVQQQRKLSVRQEIRRQSNMYVQNLSVYERNQLLIKPNAQLKKVREIVRNDKKSILLSQGSDIGFSDAGRQANLIDDEKIQHKIIRNSINMLRPKGTWYPNQQMENALSAKFSGSPQPKQFAAGGKLSNAGSDMHKSGSKQSGFQINPEKIESVSDFGATQSHRLLKFQSAAYADLASNHKLSFFKGFDKQKNASKNPLSSHQNATSAKAPFNADNESASSLIDTQMENSDDLQAKRRGPEKQAPVQGSAKFSGCKMKIDVPQQTGQADSDVCSP